MEIIVKKKIFWVKLCTAAGKACLAWPWPPYYRNFVKK